MKKYKDILKEIFTIILWVIWVVDVIDVPMFKTLLDVTIPINFLGWTLIWFATGGIKLTIE